MTEKDNRPRSSVVLWLIVWLSILVTLLKGHFAFTLVGNPGPPSWDFGAVEDVPGQSPYAIYELLPYPQHVKGEPGE